MRQTRHQPFPVLLFFAINANLKITQEYCFLLPPNRRLPGLLALLIAMVAPHSSGNEITDLQIPDVLTPMRLAAPLSEAPAAVTVITADQIQAWGIQNISDVFDWVPGMFTARSPEYRRNQVVYHSGEIRRPRRLEVLVDGQSRYDMSFSQTDWQQLGIALEDIERIEITRGPGSASYGFNAFQGMIHIITRHPSNSASVSLSGHYNSDQSRHGYAAISSHHEQFDQRLSVWADRKGEFGGTHNEATNPPDLSQTRAIDWSGQYQADSNNRFELQAGRSINQQDGSVVAQMQDESAINTTTRDHVMLTWQHQHSDEQTQLRGYWTQDNKQAKSRICLPQIAVDPATNTLYASNPDLYSLIAFLPTAGIDSTTQANVTAFYQALAAGYMDTSTLATTGQQLGYPNMTVSNEELQLAQQAALNTVLNQTINSRTCGTLDTSSLEQRMNLEWQYTRQWNNQLRSVQGISFRRDQAKSDFYFANGLASIDHWLGFANLEYRRQHWLYNLGASAIRSDNDAWLWSPRIGVNYLINPTQSLRLQLARSYRSPDIAERYLYVSANIENLDSNYSQVSAYQIPLINSASSWADQLQPEQLNSAEIGFFGSWAGNRLLLDVRLFQEHLLHLISGDLSSNGSTLDGNSYLTLRGLETQLDWRYSARSDLRTTLLLQDRNTDNSYHLIMGAERSLRTIWGHTRDEWRWHLGAVVDQSAVASPIGTWRQRRWLAGSGLDTDTGIWSLETRYDADAGTILYQHNPRWLWQVGWRIDW